MLKSVQDTSSSYKELLDVIKRQTIIIKLNAMSVLTDDTAMVPRRIRACPTSATAVSTDTSSSLWSRPPPPCIRVAARGDMRSAIQGEYLVRVRLEARRLDGALLGAHLGARCVAAAVLTLAVNEDVRRPRSLWYTWSRLAIILSTFSEVMYRSLLE
ncbi:hypothetical protein DL767_002817 [Monosporascus sp. MG133]|nr:hypothetical protein DL767_002817 [Monosporascus sp. MG133]